MAYIGKIPATGAFQKCDSLNASATADYTLQVGSTNVVPESVNHMIVSLNGVIQSPTTAYTVSGATLSFASALTSNDTIDFVILLGNVLDIGTPSDDTVATAKIQDDAVTTAKIADDAVSTDQIANDAAISTSGAITTTGAFTSIGIDDNAAATAMTIDSSGRLLVNTTNTLEESVEIFAVNDGQSTFSNNGNCIIVNRSTNDGGLVTFRQDSSTEGSITVSDTTISYGGFTGTHWSRFTDNSKPTILRGTVLETLDEMCDWYNLEFANKKIPHVLLDSQSNGDTVTYNHEGTDYQATIVKEGDVKHMKSKVSDTTDAKNVYGVFSAWDEDGEGYNDFYVASVGSYVVRIKSGETLTKGDLLQSNGDGTAKVQSDDNVKSSSFAKVLSTTIIETYDDGSFIVPCSLRC